VIVDPSSRPTGWRRTLRTWTDGRGCCRGRPSSEPYCCWGQWCSALRCPNSTRRAG